MGLDMEATLFEKQETPTDYKTYIISKNKIIKKWSWRNFDALHWWFIHHARGVHDELTVIQLKDLKVLLAKLEHIQRVPEDAEILLENTTWYFSHEAPYDDDYFNKVDLTIRYLNEIFEIVDNKYLDDYLVVYWAA